MRSSRYALAAAFAATLGAISDRPLSAPIPARKQEREPDDATRQRKRWLQRQARKIQRTHRK